MKLALIWKVIDMKNMQWGVFNDHSPALPDSESFRPESQVRSPTAGKGRHPEVSEFANILSYPYATILRSLVEQGRILEARKLLDTAGDFVPQESKIRQVLAPPRVRKSEKKGADRSAEFRWLKKNSSLYRGKWVALSGDRLVHHADSFKELIDYLDSLELAAKPLIHHID